MEFVFVPEGSFLMGVSDDDLTTELLDSAPPLVNSAPQREVWLEECYMGKYEVTNYQIRVVFNWALQQGYLEDADGNPYTGGDVYAYDQLLLQISSIYCQVDFNGSLFFVEQRDGLANDDHPVVAISWYGAAAFCNWLSEMEGYVPAYRTDTWTLKHIFGQTYRLPTEAEWERAAAWESATGYHYLSGCTTDTITTARANYAFDNPMEFTTYPLTTTIGYYNGAGAARVDGPSPVGAYDMTGGVWEWCHDWYRSDYYERGENHNPTGPSYSGLKVLRGGSWETPARNYRLRTDYRGYGYPNAPRFNWGFRVVFPGQYVIPTIPAGAKTWQSY